MEEQENHFHAAVQSVLAQEDVKVHLILTTIEGDPCLGWISMYVGDITLVVIPKAEHPGKSPEGTFYQLNKGVEHLKSEWMTFASANDVILPRKFITEISTALDAGKLVGSSNLHLTDKDLNITRTTSYKPFNGAKLLEVNFIPDQSCMNYEKLGKYLPFRTNWFNCGFWDLWLRIHEGEGNVFALSQEPTRLYRQDPTNMHLKRRRNPAAMKHYKEVQAEFRAYWKERRGGAQ